MTEFDFVFHFHSMLNQTWSIYLWLNDQYSQISTSVNVIIFEFAIKTIAILFYILHVCMCVCLIGSTLSRYGWTVGRDIRSFCWDPVPLTITNVEAIVFYARGQLMAQLRARTGGLLKNVWFSEILEEN